MWVDLLNVRQTIIKSCFVSVVSLLETFFSSKSKPFQTALKLPLLENWGWMEAKKNFFDQVKKDLSELFSYSSVAMSDMSEDFRSLES